MVSGPVLAKAAVFSLGLDHVGAMFGPATLEVDRAAGVLLVVGGALEQVDDVGGAAVQVLLDCHRPAVIE